jgi:hypothetical protein
MGKCSQDEVTRVGFFVDVDGLEELERAEKWDDARRLLLGIWEADSDDVAKLCRVFSECWYVLVEWDCCIDTDGLDPDEFKRTLIRVTTCGMARFGRDYRFLWLAGYMISLFPYLFFGGNSDALFLEWEKKGRDMMSLATDIRPGDAIARAVYLGSGKASRAYARAKSQPRPVLSHTFPGNTAIEEYFRDVLR